MHDCPKCGEYCWCDLEDDHQDAPEDCAHVCRKDGDDEEDVPVVIKGWIREVPG